MTLVLFNIILTCEQNTENNSATSLDSRIPNQVVPSKFVLSEVCDYP